MNASRIKSGVRYAFSTLVIAGLMVYIWAHRDDLGAAARISADQLLLLVTLIALSWILNSLPMMIFLRILQRRIGFWENLSVSIAGGLANYLPMRVGTLIRMRYFKSVHDLEYTTFVGIMAVRTLILLALTGGIGCIGLAGVYLHGQAVPLALWAGFALMTVLPALALVVPFPVPREDTGWWCRLLRHLASGHQALRDNPLMFWLVAGLTLAQFLVQSARLFIAFQAFGLDVSVWVLLLLGPSATLVAFLGMTPGSLGIREWAIGGLAALTGEGFQNGIFAGTLDRSVLLIMTFLIGPLCLFLTLRKAHFAK